MANRNLKPASNPIVSEINPDLDKEFTVSGLAITPAQVAEMTKKGISVSIPNLDFMDSDGAPKNDYSISPMFLRGMTREQLWQMQRQARQNVMRAQQIDKLQFGKQ